MYSAPVMRFRIRDKTVPVWLMTINICLLFPFISHLRIPEGLYASALFGLPSPLSGAFFTGSLDVACLFHKAVFRFDAIQLLQHRLCQHP